MTPCLKYLTSPAPVAKVSMTSWAEVAESSPITTTVRRISSTVFSSVSPGRGGNSGNPGGNIVRGGKILELFLKVH